MLVWNDAQCCMVNFHGLGTTDKRHLLSFIGWLEEFNNLFQAGYLASGYWWKCLHHLEYSGDKTLHI